MLVHGDVSPKNILVGPRGPVFVDAECAWFGDPAFDLAFCLNHLLLKCVHRPARTDAFLGAYRALADTYLAGVTWEPAAAVEARAATLLDGLLLARVDGKSPVEYLRTEPQRARVREFAMTRLRAHGTPVADTAGAADPPRSADTPRTADALRRTEAIGSGDAPRSTDTPGALDRLAQAWQRHLLASPPIEEDA